MDVLLDAIAEVPDVHLGILGDGVLRPTLEQQAQQLGISDRVTFHGYTSSREEVFQHLDQADMFALVSRSEMRLSRRLHPLSYCFSTSF